MAGQFMTPRQVAERWACDPSTVRALIRRGELPAMRLGLDSWRVAVSAIEAYEQARTVAPEPEPQLAQIGKLAPAIKEVTTYTTTVDGFTLPADYAPVFPELWPGHAPRTKKAAPQRH